MAEEKEEAEEGKKEEEKRRGRRKIKKMRRRDSLFPCVSASWRIPKTLAQAIPGNTVHSAVHSTVHNYQYAVQCGTV